MIRYRPSGALGVLASAALLLVPIPRAEADILISNGSTNSVLRFDETTGAFLGDFVMPGSGGLRFPQGLAYGPDGNLYVANGDFAEGKNVKRYDGASGAFLGDFTPPTNGLPLLHIGFGAGGSLYAYQLLGVAVERFNTVTGAFEPFTHGASVIGSGGFTFGRDGDLYATNVTSPSGPTAIQHYNGVTGDFLGNLVTNPALVLSGLAFGPDGNLYVGNDTDNTVTRYDFATGDFTTFASGGGLDAPTDIAFGPDGNLYVASLHSDSILRYDGRTGAFLGIAASGHGLSGPSSITFVPAPVPEPGTLVLLGAGALGLAAYAWRRWNCAA